ncbi:probable histone-lysine N-methyltransferase CG1716 [Bactrocera neohumeralis]|uniref:probable histone-lysine N-methyltransferase CG1716 n=1 Tax=Bactrocera neohumeralis TaxID=98809 RepID=UPI002165FAC5|nr:probable histone-lysine N-methyltransferase CG1716 [Bactrocera neohumeralis]XP_050329550.1 probable histone-lysine N-methyltransferase CG1716 [Bactrocera neohumeralis]
MNSASSTSDMTPQRKRVGRPPKATQLKQSADTTPPSESAQTSIQSNDTESRGENDSIMEVEGGFVAISPPPPNGPADKVNPRMTSTPSSSNECRRSSRKKIIKFDVRDLLNKHRKPHKIQIEARIDSNAPQTQTTTSLPSFSSGSNTSSSVPGSSSDLSSKQKAFMEKSAIFRRISISEQQNKINAPILPPPLSSIPKIGVLGKNTINLKSNVDAMTTLDPAKIAQARRLSRTQEIFNASLIKSKQNSSLIIAQIESNTSSSSSGFMSPAVVTSQQQKKSTNVSNKRKNLSNSFISPTVVADPKPSLTESGTQKRRGRPPKNKNPVAHSPLPKSNLKSELHITPPGKQADAHKQYSVEYKEKQDFASKEASQNATNWTEYKANLKCAESVETPVGQNPISNERTSVQHEDVILEISSTSSISDHEYQAKTVHPPTDVHESQQRNFASVCIWQDSQSICETTSAPEFIVAAVEEITSESSPADKSISLGAESETCSQKTIDTLTECDQTITIDLDSNKEIEAESDSLSEMAFGMSGTSRKSSGSESEGSSDRSNKSYKKGDKLRVSLKRLTLPPSTITSTISLSSASSSCSDVIAGSDNSNTNNSCGSNGTANTTELCTGTANKNLPTRRSHRFPKKGCDRKVIVEEPKSKAEVSLNENLETEDLKMTAGVEEKTGKLSIERVTSTTVKTDNDFEQSNKESKDSAVTTIENVSVDLVSPQQVEAPPIAIAVVELSSEQITEIPQKPNSIALDAVDNRHERTEHDRNVSEESPSVSCETKKEPITLPLKKQVSKFKMYEAAVHNVAANVATSTLLDILNTVKQNDLTMGTKAFQQLQLPAVKDDTSSEIIAPNEGEENMPITAAEKKLEAGTSDKSVTTIILEESQATDQDSSIETNKQPSKCVHIAKSGDEVESIKTFTWGNNAHDESDQRMDLPAEKCEISETVTDSDFTPLPEEEVVIQTTFAEQSVEGKETSTDEATSSPKTVAEVGRNILKKASREIPANVVNESTINVSNVLDKSAKSEKWDITNKHTTDNVLDENSLEDINSTTDSQSSRDETNGSSATKTPSPTLSENSNEKPSKKPTRRNERRSKRGDKSGHKTLEETFAEIAAASSKAVLKLKAQEVDADTANVYNEEELSKSVDAMEKSADAKEDSSASVELSQTPINLTEPKNLDEDEVPNVQNTIEITTEETTTGVCTKVCSKEDRVVLKAVILPEDVDSNSSHSSPSRRGRKTRNKKVNHKPSPSTSPITAESFSENKQKVCEMNPVNETITANTNTTADGSLEISQQNLHTSVIELNVKDANNGDQIITDTLEKGTAKESGQEKVLESEKCDYSTTTPELSTEVGQVLSTAGDETSSISNNTTPDLSGQNLEENNDQNKSFTSKPRKHKKALASAIQQDEHVDIEVESVETQKECGQIVIIKPEERIEQHKEKIVEPPKELLPNKLEKIDQSGSTPSLKEPSNVDSKINTVTSSDLMAENVDCQLPEQREQSYTPVDKPKKIRKRRSNKQSDEKSNELETKSHSKSEDQETVETKEKSGDTEDTDGKIRKPRKGKSANDATNDLQIDTAVTVPNAVELMEKELAKAPPKKRLLKMQMELEEKSSASHSEIPSTSQTSAEQKTSSAKKSASNSSKTKESTQKKSKKDAQSSDQMKKRESLESQVESSFDEESRSATSTPVAKRFKKQMSSEKTLEDKTSGKRKSKLDPNISSGEKSEIKDRERKGSISKKSEKKQFLAIEDTASKELAKKMEERSAKKKRQKKLKEDFEAALKDALTKTTVPAEPIKESANPTENIVAMLEESKLQDSVAADTVCTTDVEDKKSTVEEDQVTRATETTVDNELEEEPDPLKDIEKFIEDGVNLLKRGYKIDDDSVDEVICPKTHLQKEEYKSDVTENEEKPSTAVLEGMTTPNESISGDITPVDKSFEEVSNTLPQNIYYDTPADTPVATPTTTPPPKSPIHDQAIDEITGVRRSHRIKQITKMPKALVGRGLVREKERFSIKDDVEMKTHYSLDDHLTDLAQVEAKNAKFLKEMEERLSNFHVIKENEYKCERVVSREARKMLCDCFLTAEEEERGELGCGEDCLNRLLMIECGPDCNVKVRCTNKRFQKLLCSPCRVFRTEKKGFGIMADIEILPGEFIMEYVGEVIDGDEFEQRRTAYSLDKNRHYYFMALRSDAIIDATIKGNISRFINHSCDPNAETQKWTVNGELRIGFFSRKSIMPGEEITFDYQYQRYGREAQRCYCESANCRGWIGEEPNSDEGEQIDDDNDADNSADGSDDEDSDDSTADGEDVHKKLDASSKSLISSEDGKIKLDEKSDSAGKDKKKKVGEDAEAKLKKLTGKSADKAARKKKPSKEKKDKRLRKSATGEQSKTSRYLEDPDIEDEVKFLSRGGLRNQSDTLRFSRLVVRAKLPQTRLNLLKILRNADLPCRRLFLDYHGLRLLHGWMSEDGGDMAIRLSLLEALESLPIANKTVLTDSKVYQSVRNWCGNALSICSVPAGNASSPSDESSKESTSSNSHTEIASGQEVPSELQKLAVKLTTAWNSLPEIFRIPKRERIEQMKEHEREADRQFAEASIDSNRSVLSDRYQRDRFGRGPTTSRFSKPCFSKDNRNNNITVVGSMPGGDPRRRTAHDHHDGIKHLSKAQRREMFAAKVARDEAEKRLAEERREFETKCRFFGLDPKKTRSQDVPFCVDPSTGQWYSIARQPIPTPPCYAHVQVQPKSKSTDPDDYKLPVVVATLPRQWKYAITNLGQIYYYHTKQKISQWHPPTLEQLHAAAEEDDSSDSESCEEAKQANESSEDDDVLLGMDEAQLKAFIDKKVENRRHKRYGRLVDSRPISPRKEEDRIYNQIEMRKYKENKEKIRKRKEEIRRKRAEALKAAAIGGVNPNIVADSLNIDATKSKNGEDSNEPDGVIPIQDYLLSSDEEEIMKEECNNSPLLEKIVQGDKIVDELDALTTKRALKRTLPPHREPSAQAGQSNVSGSSSGSGGGSEHKRRKSDKKDKSKKSKDSDSKYRRTKEKFRCEIAGIIVQHLKPYRKESCTLARIQSDEDFNHLARKLTHFVMVKELKYCESVGQTLVVTESVKNKSREFIKKYMAKYGGMYVKPANDPEFKEIPFTI